MKENQSKQYPPALERAIQILDMFADSTEFDFSIKEISDELHIPYASAYRIVKCLAHYGYLSENLYYKEKYRLGYKLISLGRATLGYADFISVASPYLFSLSGVVNQSCKLSTLTQDSVITLDQALPQSGVTYISAVGKERPIDESASGQILVSLFPKSKRDPYIKKVMSCHGKEVLERFGSVEGFEQHLDDTRAKGYGLSLGEYAPNIACLSMPLYDYTGKAVAAITFSGPIEQYRDQTILDQLKEKLKKASFEISERLGYSEAGL